MQMEGVLTRCWGTQRSGPYTQEGCVWKLRPYTDLKWGGYYPNGGVLYKRGLFIAAAECYLHNAVKILAPLAQKELPRGPNGRYLRCHRCEPPRGGAQAGSPRRSPPRSRQGQHRPRCPHLPLPPISAPHLLPPPAQLP